MERLQEIIAKLETYGFECEAGPLEKCTDWEALKQLATQRDTLHAELAAVVEAVNQLLVFIREKYPNDWKDGKYQYLCPHHKRLAEIIEHPNTAARALLSKLKGLEDLVFPKQMEFCSGCGVPGWYPQPLPCCEVNCRPCVTVRALLDDLNSARAKYRKADEHRAKLLDELAELRQESKDSDKLRERLAELLTGVANALKGTPPSNVLHDWSDLPAKVATLRGTVEGVRGALKDGRLLIGMMLRLPIDAARIKQWDEQAQAALQPSRGEQG